jgi:hypothetical protein
MTTLSWGRHSCASYIQLVSSIFPLNKEISEINNYSEKNLTRLRSEKYKTISIIPPEQPTTIIDEIIELNGNCKLLKSNIDANRAETIRSRRGTPANANRITFLSNIKNADEMLAKIPEDMSPITTPHSPNSGNNSNIRTTEVVAPINPGHKRVLVFILA